MKSKPKAHKQNKKTNGKRMWYDIAIEYLLYSLAIIVPAVFWDGFYSVFGAPKLLALRLITLAVLFLWGLKIIVEKKAEWRKSRYNIALFFYALICVVTTVFSSAFYTSLYGQHGIFLGMLTILDLLLLPVFIWNFLREKQLARKLLFVGFFTSSLLAVYGILQYFGVWQEQFNWNQQPADRVFGTIGHGNHFGAYLGMNFVLGIFLVKEINQKILRYAGWTGLTVIGAAVLLTASRGAVLALMVALVFCGAAILFKKKALGELHVGKWLAPAFVVVAIMIGGAVIFKDEIARFPLIERTAITIESIGDGKIPDRYSWWLSAAEMAKDRPLTGYGLSTFRDIYNSYRRLDYETVEEGDQEAHITPEAAHNEYLTIAATQGVLGLMAWLFVVLLIIGKINGALFGSAEAAKNPDKEKTPAISVNPYFYSLLGLKGALIVYLVQAFLSFGVLSTLTVFFVYAGAALVLASPDFDRDRLRQIFSGAGAAAAGRWMLVTIIILVVGAGSFFTLREVLADYHYKSALTAAANYNHQGALEHFSRVIAYMPHEYAYRQAFGDYLLQAAEPVSAYETRLEMLEQAVAAYDGALEINMFHPSIEYNRAVAKIRLFQLTAERQYYEDAVKDFEASVEKALNNPLYPYQAAKEFMKIQDENARYNSIYYLLLSMEIRENYRDAGQLIEQLTGKKLTPVGAPAAASTSVDAVVPAESTAVDDSVPAGQSAPAD